ncbi:carbohydrate sulfotransferase 15-like [Watersipora subatra]|uniref:carbohydrate sulfotransferase 15-like n=1 Tax=Watersipora subatra TaxID=2589382 RepID=UPI00355BD3EB
MDYFNRKHHKQPKTGDLMNYSPGELLFSVVKKQNSTHIVISTTVQHIAFVSDPSRSKYIVTLRNPTDRLISYIFHAHNHKWIYENVEFDKFNGAFIHSAVVSLHKKLKECLRDYEELACVYRYSSADGNLDAVLQHGLYVIYLEELFRFLPRESIYINQLEEYSANQLVEAAKIMKFFGHQFNETDSDIVLTSEKKMNSGHKTNVLPETIKLLNDLYRPYNIRLARLLGDNKWLYE